jgi:hypothetical protein
MTREREASLQPSFLGVPVFVEGGPGRRKALVPRQMVKGDTSCLQALEQGLLRVYMSLEDYHYRVIDSVLPLDGWLGPVQAELVPGAWADGVCCGKLTLAGVQEIALNRELFSGVDEDYRGGARLIFESQRLAEVVEQAIRRAELQFPTEQEFLRVNPVFRMNLFEPGDS